jgi:hypothetical protein
MNLMRMEFPKAALVFHFAKSEVII